LALRSAKGDFDQLPREQRRAPLPAATPPTSPRKRGEVNQKRPEPRDRFAALFFRGDSTALSLSLTLSIALVLRSATALALDKQGSAHGGEVEGPKSGVDLSGGLMLGAAFYNPSYAARPDNTGKTLMRYAAHADIDLIGRRLSIPLDLNMFTDRERAALGKLAPTELDVIAGVTTTWALGPGALELGTRFEHDRPLDRAGDSQSYIDVRSRYVYSLARSFPGLGAALGEGDVSGWMTLGWFAYNPSYFARPDNTGRALLRYAGHVELSILDDLVSFGVDATLFSDRQASDVVRPTELDLTPEMIFHEREFELHLAFESDRPIDRGGLVQEVGYALGVWNFSWFEPHRKAPFEERGQILSP